MGNNGAKEENSDLLKLHDWKIRRVKDGLDEAEVVDIISKLVDQRDQLIERTDHLSSLTRLAEKTVAGADELAKQIEAESTQQAEAKAATIVADAEEQAQDLRRENQRVKVEFKRTIDDLCKQLISEPTSFTQRIQTLWTESENKLSELEAIKRPITHEAILNQANSPDSTELTKEVESTASGETEKTADSPTPPQLKAEPHVVDSNPSTTPIWRDTSWH